MLEVIVAVVILGLSYVTVLQCFSLSLRNISKIEEKRTRLYDEVSQLLHASHFTGDKDEAAEGEEFISGQKYRLLLISSESGDLKTLRLEKAGL